MLTRGYRGLHRDTRGYKGLQGLTKGYRGLRVVTGFYIVLEWVMGGKRGYMVLLNNFSSSPSGL